MDNNDREKDVQRTKLTWNARMMQIGWAVSISGVLFLVIFVFGLFAGWFSLGGDWDEDTIAVSVAMNTENVADSANAAVETISEANDKVNVVASSEVIDGRVLSIGQEGQNHIINLKRAADEQDSKEEETPEGPESFISTDATEYKGESSTIKEIAEGDFVQIVFRHDKKKDKRFALKVTEQKPSENDIEKPKTETKIETNADAEPKPDAE